MIRIKAPVVHEDDTGTVRKWEIQEDVGDRVITRTPDKGIYSIERPWLYNKPNVSRIPNDIYSVIPWVSPSKGPVWALLGGTVSPYKDDVPYLAKRWGVLIHVANYPRNVEGCLGLGDSYAEHDPSGCPAVWNSLNTISAFRKIVHGQAVMMLHLTGEMTEAKESSALL
jgi:hypothetical protein